MRWARSKGQISFEYLVILGLTLAAILPAAYFIYTYTQGNRDDVTKAQINSIGKKVLDQAESTYALGAGNWVTVGVNMPAEVKSIKVHDGQALVIEYQGGGISHGVFFSNIPLKAPYNLVGGYCGACPDGMLTNRSYLQGQRKIRVTSNSTYVLLSIS